MSRTPAEVERARRIRIAVLAYAYEIMDDPIVSDEEYDHLAQQIDLTASTGHHEMDRWFLANYSPSTGMWVRNHPGILGLNRIYKSIRSARLDTSSDAR